MKRIYHPWHAWECYAAGFYGHPVGVDADACREAYRAFLSDLPRFGRAMGRVLDEWPVSCEQFLSDKGINRVAWMGQAAMCIDTGMPCWYRGGFKLLTPAEQRAANELAALYIRKWELRYADRHSTKSAQVRGDMEAARLF